MTHPEENQSQNPSDTVDEALKKAAGDDAPEAKSSVEAALESAEAAVDETPEAALEAALAEAEKYKDLALRAEAEMQNVRRRAAQDVEKAHKFGLEKVIGNLLPVADSLEKAIEAAETAEGADTPAVQAIIEGMNLCRRMLLDVLSKEGAELIDPEGVPFDPNLHQAMSMVENGEVEPNTVLTVVQKGYTLNGRLVRPAMVMVSKAPA